MRWQESRQRTGRKPRSDNTEVRPQILNDWDREPLPKIFGREGSGEEEEEKEEEEKDDDDNEDEE